MPQAPGLCRPRRRLPAEGPRDRRPLLLLARGPQLRCRAAPYARNVDAVLGAGTLAGLRHDFREQLRLGLEARRLAPALTAPYPVIADAQIELGRYGDAERTLQRMLDSKPNLTAYSRVSYYRELNGDLEGAVQSMRLAVSAGAAVSENVAYVQTLLGDLELQRGRPAAAQRLPGRAGSAARLRAGRGRTRACAERRRRSRRRRAAAAGRLARPSAHQSPHPAGRHRCRPRRPGGRRARPRRGARPAAAPAGRGRPRRTPS